MAESSDPTDVSVSERRAGYSDAKHGPTTDATVHVRETPLGIEPRFENTPPPKGPRVSPSLPDLRKSLRAVDEVERSRERRLPDWAPTAIGGGLFLLAIAVGGWWLVSYATQRAAAPPPKPRPVAEEIQGVPVRKGLQDAPGE